MISLHLVAFLHLGIGRPPTWLVHMTFHSAFRNLQVLLLIQILRRPKCQQLPINSGELLLEVGDKACKLVPS